MDDRPWLYYKLTSEPKGSGELKSKFKTYEMFPWRKLNNPKTRNDIIKMQYDEPWNCQM